MEKLKYSILVSPYGNGPQFYNFLSTAGNQDYNPYEIIVVDNATPTNEVSLCCQKAKCRWAEIRYFNIPLEEKQCTNITQGINIAAEKARGENIVIVADSNVLLSFNLLSKIDELMEKNTLVLSAGKHTDVKISTNGTYGEEYKTGDRFEMSAINASLLERMGWPCDPIDLKLLDGKHRFPSPHTNFDCYIVAMAKSDFLALGGYNEDQKNWGDYHADFVKKTTKILITKKLDGVRIVHQYHRVFKEEGLWEQRSA